ncbi:unnamed protein product, partial [Staurois parvus]
CLHSRPRLSITGSRPVITHWHPKIAEYHRWGRELYVTIVISPVSSCTLLCMALHSRASGKHTQPHSKTHTQHTVNPLIAQMLTPSCPVPLVQCQCFLLALITVLVSLGIPVTPSQFPPVSECPPQS